MSKKMICPLGHTRVKISERKGSPVVAIDCQECGATATVTVPVEVELVVTGSQHDRPPDEPPPLGYPGDHEIRRLAEFSDDLLLGLGLRRWNDPDDPEQRGVFKKNVLWLLPAEWHPFLPDGLELTDINGRKMVFNRADDAASDDDRRFGVLAYGVLKPHQRKPAARG